MPTPGYVFRDGGTTPPNEAAEATGSELRPNMPARARQPHPTVVQKSPLSQATSESHALATQSHQLHGAVHEAGKTAGITNLGWQANATGLDRMVGGLQNEELWTLVRRFNKVTMA